jgi:sporulation protein YlmC with PRC-barrel domain
MDRHHKYPTSNIDAKSGDLQQEIFKFLKIFSLPKSRVKAIENTVIVNRHRKKQSYG